MSLLARSTSAAWLAAAVVAMVGTGCTHALTVKNLDLYSAPARIGGSDVKPKIAILPYTGPSDGLFYFNAIVERLSLDPSIEEVRTDYVPSRANSQRFQPDLILSINPQVTYRSSGWNFLVNWPGFLIFTPAWNGYIYRADVNTQISIQDRDGNLITQAQIPVNYNIRHADMDRTIWTGLTWLEVSALALIGGIYNANVFDRDVIGPLQVQVKDNYANYVMNQLLPKIRAAAEAVIPPEPEPTREATTGEEGLPGVSTGLEAPPAGP